MQNLVISSINSSTLNTQPQHSLITIDNESQKIYLSNDNFLTLPSNDILTFDSEINSLQFLPENQSVCFSTIQGVIHQYFIEDGTVKKCL